MIVDSSSLINLFNADALEIFCAINRCSFFVPPLVMGECDGQCAEALLSLREHGCLDFIDDTSVDADNYIELLDRLRLGAGETECIAVATTSHDIAICCDDLRARNKATDVLGADRVIGSMRLLRWCVEDTILKCDEAYKAFNVMREKGGFLPDITQSFFCGNV